MRSARHIGILLVLLACASSALPQLPEDPFPPEKVQIPAFPIQPGGPFDRPTPFPTGGRLKLDVIVTDKAVNPVAGLKPENFRLLDEGVPQELVTFQAFDGSNASADPPPEVILVIDRVNLSGQQAAVAEREAEKFLRQNDGHLEQAVAVYRFTTEGLFLVADSSTNGNDLAAKIASGTTARAVLVDPIRVIHPFLMTEHATARNLFSVRALGLIVLEQRRKPGRKLLIWLGPGWPISAASTDVGVNGFDWVTEFSTRMRDARIVLDSVTEWPGTDPGFFYQDHVKGLKTGSAVGSANLALPVLAIESGGRVVLTGNDLAGAIGKCASEAGVFYSLSFDPPRTEHVDEYHELNIQLANPQLTARTNTGYYDEPVFYDQPGAPKESVSLEQFEQRFAGAEKQSDQATANAIFGLQLTERMSGADFDQMKVRMRGRRSRAALVILADESAFKPSRTINPEPAEPTVDEQRAMLARTIDYLSTAIPRLPDFFATRTIDRYASPPQKYDAPWKTATGSAQLSLAETSTGTILYRNGRETVDTQETRSLGQRRNASSLDTEGTFGAMLSTVLMQAAQSDLAWSRWEQGPAGVRAVFRYAVPVEKSKYTLSFCCLNGMFGLNVLEQAVGYHGEIVIDASSGEITRLTVQADLDSRMPVIRADMLVIYAPIEIGGKRYVCPVRSIAIGRRRTLRVIHEWSGSLTTWAPYETMLNDVTFSKYHMARSEMRILPGFTQASQ